MTALLVTLCNLRLFEALNINVKHDVIVRARVSRIKIKNTVELIFKISLTYQIWKVDDHFTNIKFNIVYY